MGEHLRSPPAGLGSLCRCIHAQQAFRDYAAGVAVGAALPLIDRVGIVTAGPPVRLHIDVAATDRAFENISRPCLTHDVAPLRPRARIGAMRAHLPQTQVLRYAAGSVCQMSHWFRGDGARVSLPAVVR